MCFHCSVSKNTVFLKTLFIKQILESWPFVILSFLNSMFPQCPHPVASYTFNLTCRYLIKNNKGTFYLSVIAYSGSPFLV